MLRRQNDATRRMALRTATVARFLIGKSNVEISIKVRSVVEAKENCQPILSFLCHSRLHHLVLLSPYLIFSIYVCGKLPNISSRSVHPSTLSRNTSLPGMSLIHLSKEVRHIT